MELAANPLRWLLLLLLGLSFALADDELPKISLKEFDSPVGFPQYFAHSDTVLLFQNNPLTGQGSGKLWISKNGGEEWDEVIAGKEKQEVLDVREIVLHPFNEKIAFALTTATELYYTHDQGETWDVLNLPPGLHPSRSAEPFSFTPGDHKKIVFNTQHYLTPGGWLYEEEAWYSDDGLASIERLADNTRQCVFAQSKAEFKNIDADRILCVIRGKLSGLLPISDDRLMISDDRFEKDIREPITFEGRTVQGIVSIAAAKGYLLAAAAIENSVELALFVSVDGETWHMAEFGHEGTTLEQDGYTVLESTNYSIQVVVQNGPSATLMSSNSNGTYFEKNLDHLKESALGYVDFEKVQGFQGVVIANVIDNAEAAEEKGKKAKYQSKISFQDGKDKTWDRLKTKGEHLNLHSVTDARNLGRVFSSAAPGVMLGVGNKGSHLKDYYEGDLYVSNDAGRNWDKALEGAWKYEFADEGNILLAVSDAGEKERTKKAKYSINHGADWVDLEFDSEEFKPLVVTTRSDSTSLRVLVTGLKPSKNDEPQHSVVFSLDFDKVLESTCGKDDMEDFAALKDDEPCIMGHKQTYRRRKRDAKCFVRDKEERSFTEEVCACKKEDFECDFNFKPKDGECQPAGKLTAGEGQCKEKDDKFKSSSGFRLIPGDDCDPEAEGAENLDKEIERPCSEAGSSSPHTGDKVVATFVDQGKENRVSSFDEIVYLERSKFDRDDGSILFLDNQRVFISFDHGKTWKPLDELHSRMEKAKIVRIVQHEYLPQVVFFITDYKTMWYSKNAGKDIHSFEVPHAWPAKTGSPFPMSFHPERKEWIIWTGESCDGDVCRWVTSLSQDGGDDWRTLAKSADKCEFIKPGGRDRNLDDDESRQLIFCQRRAGESADGKMELIKSTDFFQKTDTVFEDILTFATMSEFIVVAKRGDESLTVNASVAGGPFAPAHFPWDFQSQSSTYTVLQSETHAIFMMVSTNERKGAEYGRIMKSNANGTYYVTSIDNVNRDQYGYTDFEKVQGLEGVSLVNIVSNVKEVDSGEPKKLQTRITHNDGADWTSLQVPAKNYEGRNFCQSEDCKIHLHAFTEKLHHPRLYSSDTAIGLLIANGNVGEFLDHDPASDATFMSRDGGLSWYAVGKGKHYWAYGDQGSIVVLVPQGKTNKLRYSLRQGQPDSTRNEAPWEEFQFADEDIDVTDLTTVPSDNAKNFVIWGLSGKSPVTINIDFSAIRERTCELSKDSKDYENWSPKHPGFKSEDDDCLFGHKSLYHRRRLEADCWNGFRINPLHEIVKNCTCSPQDFECDYNYERTKDGDCQLVTGLAKPDHSQICRDDPSAVEYFEPTGFRRIPLDTCQGGAERERQYPRPCAGHEKEFEERHRGLSGFAFFLVAICLPFGAAAAIGYYVYKRWDGKFGAIRLGENGNEGVLDIDKPWVKYSVLVLSGLAAVVMATPGILGSAWRGVSSFVGRSPSRYTSRASFARNRGDYTVVDDEDELLGDDDEDEV